MRSIVLPKVLAFILLFPLPALYAADANHQLLKNSDFSQGDPTNGAESWTRGDPALVSLVTEEGNQFLRIKVPRPQAAIVEQIVDIPEGSGTLDLAVNVLASDIKPGSEQWMTGQFQYIFLDAQGKKIGQSRRLAVREDTDGWKTLEKKNQNVPENAVKLKAQLGVWGASGSFDFDDVKVVSSIAPKKKMPIAAVPLSTKLGLDLNKSVDIEKPSASLPSDPKRVKIIVGEHGKTVGRADGERIRGAAIWVWKGKMVNRPEDMAYAFEPAYFEALKEGGVNGIRLSIFDPWVNSQPKKPGASRPIADFTNAEDLAMLFHATDTIIDLASKHDMYVLLNFHNVGKYKGRYGEPKADSIEYLKQFWQAFGTRYKDRTHVFYEMFNEPVFFPEHWSDDVLDDMAKAYKHMRELAPQTHISLFSFATLGVSWNNIDIDDIIKRFEARHPGLVDWSNASVAFHPYNKRAQPSDSLRRTMKQWPVINTEAHFPKSMRKKVMDSDKQTQQLDDDAFVHQTMERLGISWLQHKVSGWKHFPANWPLILEDAKAKEYLWFKPAE